MRRLWLMMLLVAALGAAASAQETTGTITGVTTDQSGAVLPGVTVTVKNTGTGLTRTVVTNEAGIYTAGLLPIGAYEVTFELSGFQACGTTHTGFATDFGASKTAWRQCQTNQMDMYCRDRFRLEWSRDGSALRITTPHELPGEGAVALRITLGGA